jgi:hypothetical protein
MQDLRQVSVGQDERATSGSGHSREVQAHPPLQGTALHSLHALAYAPTQRREHICALCIAQTGHVEELLYSLQQRGAGGDAKAAAKPAAAPAARSSASGAKPAAAPPAAAPVPAPAAASPPKPGTPSKKPPAASPAPAPTLNGKPAPKAQSRLDAGAQQRRAMLAREGAIGLSYGVDVLAVDVPTLDTCGQSRMSCSPCVSARPLLRHVHHDPPAHPPNHRG